MLTLPRRGAEAEAAEEERLKVKAGGAFFNLENAPPAFCYLHYPQKLLYNIVARH